MISWRRDKYPAIDGGLRHRSDRVNLPRMRLGLATGMRRLCFPYLLAVCLLSVGCRGLFKKPPVQREVKVKDYSQKATRIEYPNVDVLPEYETSSIPEPRTIGEPEAHPTEFWDIPLEDVLRMALQESEVIRESGGLVLRAPETMRSIQDPAIRETDPQLGILAALSAYDPQFLSSLVMEKNDRAFNNVFSGGGSRDFNQDFSSFEAELSKVTPTGSEFILRNLTEYDSNTSPGNEFLHSWNTQFEAEVRQRLLQGAGLDFNRIAGPNAIPGVSSGVVIARINTDLTQADFEFRVRNFINDVENAYWDLYFAYRDLDAKIRARNAALETWQDVYLRYQTGRPGGENSNEAQAREQYYRLQQDVQNALTGRLVEGTRGNNGATGGSFRGNPGVYVTERRLRYLIGLPATDHRLLRPADEPITSKVTFDWEQAKAQALTQRVELRRQRWTIKRRELELKAARNFLLPKLDAVGRYRRRGLGLDLFSQGNAPYGSFNSAFENLTDSSYDEWQLGFELSFPFGYRQANSGVRNAELQLARERSILHEQERTVMHSLSESVAEMKRAFTVLDTAYNRRLAAAQQLEFLQEAFDRDQVQINVLLDSQRRLAEADADFYRALVDYTISIKNVHLDKGTLLQFNRVFLEEGMWPEKAYRETAKTVAWSVRELPMSGHSDVPLDEYSMLANGGSIPQPLTMQGFSDDSGWSLPPANEAEPPLQNAPDPHRKADPNAAPNDQLPTDGPVAGLGSPFGHSANLDRYDWIPEPTAEEFGHSPPAESYADQSPGIGHSDDSDWNSGPAFQNASNGSSGIPMAPVWPGEAAAGYGTAPSPSPSREPVPDGPGSGHSLRVPSVLGGHSVPLPVIEPREQ